MTKEIFKPWRPLDGIPSPLWLEAVHDDAEGLRFLLRGEKPSEPTLRIRWDTYVCYRNINESFRLRTWAQTPELQGPQSLFIAENSSWLRWVVDESGGALDENTLTHYAIYTPEDCIDIVAQHPPDVDWPNK